MKANKLATLALGAALVFPATGVLAKDKPAFADQLKTVEATLGKKEKAAVETQALTGQVTEQVRTAIEACHTGNRVNISDISTDKLEPDMDCLIRERDQALVNARSEQERIAMNQEFDHKILRAIQNVSVFLDIIEGDCDGGFPAGSACPPPDILDPAQNVKKLINAISSPQLQQQALKGVDSEILDTFRKMSTNTIENGNYDNAEMLRIYADQYHVFIDRAVTDLQKQKEAHKIVDKTILTGVSNYVRGIKGKPSQNDIYQLRVLYEKIKTPEFKKEAEQALIPVVKKAQK